MRMSSGGSASIVTVWGSWCLSWAGAKQNQPNTSPWTVWLELCRQRGDEELQVVLLQGLLQLLNLQMWTSVPPQEGFCPASSASLGSPQWSAWKRKASERCAAYSSSLLLLLLFLPWFIRSLFIRPSIHLPRRSAVSTEPLNTDIKA